MRSENIRPAALSRVKDVSIRINYHFAAGCPERGCFGWVEVVIFTFRPNAKVVNTTNLKGVNRAAVCHKGDRACLILFTVSRDGVLDAIFWIGTPAVVQLHRTVRKPASPWNIKVVGCVVASAILKLHVMGRAVSQHALERGGETVMSRSFDDALEDTEIGIAAQDPGHDTIRQDVLWGAYMAGADGVEWYFGYQHPNNDLNCEDWRSRDILWDQTRHAMDFFNDYLPYADMENADEITAAENDFVLAKAGEVYAIYQAAKGSTNIDLSGASGTYTVDWYDPRNGGDLQKGSIAEVEGNASHDSFGETLRYGKQNPDSHRKPRSTDSQGPRPVAMDSQTLEA